MNNNVEISIMNAVVEFLKNYIWKNGFDKLSEKPFDVYKDMVKSDKNKKDAIDLFLDEKIAKLERAKRIKQMNTRIQNVKM